MIVILAYYFRTHLSTPLPSFNQGCQKSALILQKIEVFDSNDEKRLPF